MAYVLLCINALGLKIIMYLVFSSQSSTNIWVKLYSPFSTKTIGYLPISSVWECRSFFSIEDSPLDNTYLKTSPINTLVKYWYLNCLHTLAASLVIYLTLFIFNDLSLFSACRNFMHSFSRIVISTVLRVCDPTMRTCKEM